MRVASLQQPSLRAGLRSDVGSARLAQAASCFLLKVAFTSVGRDGDRLLSVFATDGRTIGRIFRVWYSPHASTTPKATKAATIAVRINASVIDMASSIREIMMMQAAPIGFDVDQLKTHRARLSPSSSVEADQCCFSAESGILSLPANFRAGETLAWRSHWAMLDQGPGPHGPLSYQRLNQQGIFL